MVDHLNKSNAKFHEDQEVEVRFAMMPRSKGQANWLWRKAKIVGGFNDPDWLVGYAYFIVEFSDGTCATFDTKHIRVIETEEEKTAARQKVFRRMYHGSD